MSRATRVARLTSSPSTGYSQYECDCSRNENERPITCKDALRATQRRILSYSYIVGNAWFPVTGGLFLGDDVTNASTQTTGHFPDSQDQRNTLRTRFQYQVTSQFWLATSTLYGSGLSFDFDGTESGALAQYGPSVVSRLNFNRGRVDPSLSIQASLGVDVYKTERVNIRFQADCDNLNNRLNVIDFGGLFSGNAIGPVRSFSLRLMTNF